MATHTVPPTPNYTAAMAGVLRALESTRAGTQTEEPPASHVLTVAAGRLEVVAKILDALAAGELTEIDRGWLHEMLGAEISTQAAAVDRVRIQLEQAEAQAN